MEEDKERERGKESKVVGIGDKEDREKTDAEAAYCPSREELIQIIEEMIKNYEKLPQHAMLQPVTHYDISSLLFIMSSILRVS